MLETLLRRWWLVALGCAIGIVCAYYFAGTAAHRYQSTVSLQLNPAATSSFLPYQTDSSAGGSNPVLVQASSYQEVLRSRTFGQVIVQQLNLPLSPEAVAGAISTQLVPNTNILHLSVTWDNPSDAQQLAQHVAEIFIAENQRRQESQPGTQAQLADLEQSARDLQARRGPLQEQRDRLDESVARGDLSHLNDLTALETRLSALDSSYANLLVEMSRLRGSFDTAVILDTATPARSLDSLPFTQALVFGVLAGAGAAAVVALLIERAADVVRVSPDAIAATGLPLLGRVKRVRVHRRRGERSGRSLVARDEPDAAATEAFRSLRAAVLLSTPPHAPLTLVVSAAQRGDGATFVAANLATVLAQAGRRVVLIDGNLRKPELHTLFNRPNSRGVVDALRRSLNSKPVESAVVATDVQNLGLLPAGEAPRDVGEVLKSDAIARTFEELTREWDTLIVDTADLGNVADSLLLAHEANACLVVARAGRTTRTALAAAVGALDGATAQVIGVVLNDERPRPLGRFVRSPHYAPVYANAHGVLFDQELAPMRLPRNGHTGQPTTVNPSGEPWRE